MYIRALCFDAVRVASHRCIPREIVEFSRPGRALLIGEGSRRHRQDDVRFALTEALGRSPPHYLSSASRIEFPVPQFTWLKERIKPAILQNRLESPTTRRSRDTP